MWQKHYGSASGRQDHRSMLEAFSPAEEQIDNCWRPRSHMAERRTVNLQQHGCQTYITSVGAKLLPGRPGINFCPVPAVSRVLASLTRTICPTSRAARGKS